MSNVHTRSGVIQTVLDGKIVAFDNGATP